MHCAANTGFHVPLDEILQTNTIGFVELLKVAAGCKRLQVRACPLTSTVGSGDWTVTRPLQLVALLPCLILPSAWAYTLSTPAHSMTFGRNYELMKVPAI